MTTKADFFTPERANHEMAKEHLSPSGNYRLVITPFETREGCWGFTQGLVYEVESQKLITEVQRNYSSFPFLWIEDHPNGHPYLVCGEDYQGQTVIELDTGKRKNFLPEGANKGFGFCWAEYQFNRQLQMIIVDGCFWACPYEYRFYDFSNPMEGWPEIETDRCVYAGNEFPKVEGGFIKCVQQENTEDVTTFFQLKDMKLTATKEVRGDRVFDAWISNIVKEVEEAALDAELEAHTFWDNEGEPETMVRSSKSDIRFRLFLGAEDDGSRYGFTATSNGEHKDIPPTLEGALAALEEYVQLTKSEVCHG